MVKPFQLLPLLLLLYSTSLYAQTLDSASNALNNTVVEKPSSPSPIQPISEKGKLLKVDSLYRFSISGDVGIFFLSFDQRRLFTEQLHSFAADAKKAAATSSDSIAIKTVPFQQVNFFFPLHLALHFHPYRWLSLGLGGEWKQESQEALLLSSHGVDEFIYSITTWSGYLELTGLIPERLFSIQGGDGVRVSIRRYWLPASWIATHWAGEEKKLWSKSDFTGAGWGVSVGSYFANLGPIKAFFELEWRSVQAESEQAWSKILPDHRSDDKAKWSLGGLGANLRLTWPHSLKITTTGSKDVS